MLTTFDIIGTYVFCVSGAMAARQKDMDYFGMFMLAVITGTGGGTLRSLLIGDTPPAVFISPIYLGVSALAVMTAIFATPIWEQRRRAVSTVDAIGLGVFVCSGVEIAVRHELSWWASVGLGVISATFGGVLRDIARTEVPLIFRQEIYATACLAGGLVFYGLRQSGLDPAINYPVTIITTAGIRLLAIRYALNRSS